MATMLTTLVLLGYYSPAGALTFPASGYNSSTASKAPAADHACHVGNLKGKKFGINQPGEHMLLRVPAGPQVAPLLVVKAFVGTDGEDGMGSCRLYMRRLSLSGEWLDHKAIEVFAHQRNEVGSNGAGNVTVQPFSMMLHRNAARKRYKTGKLTRYSDLRIVETRHESGTIAISHKISYVATSRSLCKKKSCRKKIESQSLDFRIAGSKVPATITVSQTLHQALSIELANVAKLGFKAMGGLLGTEGHPPNVEEKTAACKAAIGSRASMQPQDRSELVGYPDAAELEDPGSVLAATW